MRRVARFYVHDPENRCQTGDLVRIQETRPISKLKHWRLLEILSSRQLAEVQPIELETEITPVLTGEALAETPADAVTAEAVAEDASAYGGGDGVETTTPYLRQTDAPGGPVPSSRSEKPVQTG